MLNLEAKSPVTSADWFANMNNRDLAYWLAEDARRLDGSPRNNNHVAATRLAALRLDRLFEEGVER